MSKMKTEAPMPTHEKAYKSSQMLNHFLIKGSVQSCAEQGDNIESS